MSKENGYATKDALQALSRKPRVNADVTIPGWGRMKLQSITAGEYARIEAAQNRATLLAASERSGPKHVAAVNNAFLELVKVVVAEPAFTDDDRDLLLSLDSSIANAIKDACYAHCRLNEIDLETAQKK